MVLTLATFKVSACVYIHEFHLAQLMTAMFQSKHLTSKTKHKTNLTSKCC